MISLADALAATPYASYSYSYPHKTAYRSFDTPLRLDEVWAAENRDSLFLYLHVPFCEMRCGFCNLFTTTNRERSLETAYLDALERQARQVRAALGEASFARLAIGGGTPTFLQPGDLARLLNIATTICGVQTQRIPISVETSPQTATVDKLQLLRDWGVNRISIGIQSFIEAEVHAIGRAQKTSVVEAALQRIRATGFPTLNLDLMYGLPNQTLTSWLDSLATALRYTPEEIYLYPLYVRPLTGLGRRQDVGPAQAAQDLRLNCYRAGRDFLLAQGYEQVSMRMFQKQGHNSTDAPVYCCQEDGLVGLGCGARSYTQALHYATEYAVSATGVRSILADYIQRPADSFAYADYGFALNAEEQRRRYVIQSLLQATGLDLAAYRARFDSEALEDLPQLHELTQHGMARWHEGNLRLTPDGMEKSDVIGPWLGSMQTQAAMQEYALH